ncbi:MAG TPA: hypothetical protein VFD43_00375 [Planctomycetota bacterium]|nr:hypothetical protein [Planctomycetota bacterium]
MKPGAPLPCAHCLSLSAPARAQVVSGPADISVSSGVRVITQ